jgi:hypothetical protein
MLLLARTCSRTSFSYIPISGFSSRKALRNQLQPAQLTSCQAYMQQWLGRQKNPLSKNPLSKNAVRQIASRQHDRYTVRCQSLLYGWRILQASAKRRGFNVSISFQLFCVLVNQVCVNCGSSPLRSEFNGIDRVVSPHGYCPKNVVASCGPCNMMKPTLSLPPFIRRGGLSCRWRPAPNMLERSLSDNYITLSQYCSEHMLSRTFAPLFNVTMIVHVLNTLLAYIERNPLENERVACRVLPDSCPVCSTSG